MIDPKLNKPGKGLRLRVTNNGDGTITLGWFGYNLEAVDPSGQWRVEESLDGQNWTDIFGTSPGQLGSNWGAGTLGVVNYYRVLAKDSGAVVLRTSNTVSTTLPEPWEITGSKMWRDFDTDAITTVTGSRLVRSSSQYYTAPHASDLNFGAAMTCYMGVHKQLTASQTEEVYVSKGTIGAANNGWHIGTGANSASYSGGAVRLFNTLTGAANSPETAGEEFISFFAVRYDAGTVKIQKDGSDKTVTVGGSMGTVLASNTDTLKIGVDLGATASYGYKYSNMTFPVLAFWNRVLTDEEIDALDTGGDTPVAYADLETLSPGITSGLVRWWENGELQCKVTSGANGLLTAVNGPIDTEDRIVAAVDRASGTIITTPYGRAPRARTSVVGTAPSAHCDSVFDLGGTVGYSRCGMRAAITDDIFDATSCTVFNIYRLETALHGTEHWFSTVDNGTLDYMILGGYQIKTATYRPYMRFKRTTGSAVNGGWYANDSTVALATNYKEVWTVDTDGSVTINVNDSAKTAVKDFGGGSPTPDGSIQDFTGIGLNGGGSPRGNLVSTAVYNRVLTAAQIAQIKAWILAEYGV